MIRNQFIHKCNIWRKVIAAQTYGGKASDTYELYKSDVPCLLLQVTGKSNVQGETGRNLITDAFLRIETQVNVPDKLVIDSYNYIVHQVKEVRNLVTTRIEYYQASVEKQRASTEVSTATIT